MTGEEAASEIHQFLSMVRARLAGALEAEGVEESEPERLWREAYGRIELEPGDAAGLVKQFGGIMHTKLNVAALVVIELLMDLGAATDRPDIISILDELELRLADRIDGRE